MMMNNRLVLGIAAIIGSCFVTDALPTSVVRVTNATEVEPHSLPWIVNIRAATTHEIICTGIIYNERFILTVASCVETVLPQTLEVVVGEHNIGEVDGAEVQVRIAAVIPNELYQEATHFDDIALLELAEPLTWSEAIQPGNFPTVDDENPTATNCKTAGWGEVEAGSGVSSPVLLGTDLTLMADSDCRDIYLGTGLIGSSMICAASETNSVPCGVGDDGAPLMCGDDNQIVGIYSWSEGCGEGFPPVFTQISQFLTWIDEIANA